MQIKRIPGGGINGRPGYHVFVTLENKALILDDDAQLVGFVYLPGKRSQGWTAHNRITNEVRESFPTRQSAIEWLS